MKSLDRIVSSEKVGAILFAAIEGVICGGVGAEIEEAKCTQRQHVALTGEGDYSCQIEGLKFEEYLKEHGIIHRYTYANSVHDRMDRDIAVRGPDHREIDFYHSEDGIRERLRGFSHLIACGSYPWFQPVNTL